MFPTKVQFRKWSLPSKYSFFGVLLSIAGVAISIFSLFIDTKYEDGFHRTVLFESRVVFLQKSIDVILPDIELPEPVLAPFLDVKEYHGHSKYVAFAMRVGIINPSSRENTHFHPFKEISRGEAAKILANVMCYSSGVQDCYSRLNYDDLLNIGDISEHTEFHPYIAFLVKNDILNGSEIFGASAPLSISNSERWISKAKYVRL